MLVPPRPAVAPAPEPQPQLQSLSEIVSKLLSPRSPSDHSAPPWQASLPEARHRAELRTTPTPTRTTTEPGVPASAIPVAARADAKHTPTTIPGGYGGLGSGLDPGTIVGITLGSVGGFMLLLWLIYWCINLGRVPVDADARSTVSMGTSSVLTQRLRRDSRHRSHRGHSHRRHHHHRSPRRETVEVRTGRGPFVVGEGAREVVVEETVRGVSRGPPAAPPPPRVVEDEDEVVVIEEDSRPRRHRSRRSGSRRRESGYRDVDPDRFAGGDAPVREVRRSGGSRRR